MIGLSVLEMLVVLILSSGLGTLLLLMGTQEKLLQDKKEHLV